MNGVSVCTHMALGIMLILFMPIVKDVVEYLHGNQSADLLLGVAARTNLLRLKVLT